MPRPSRRDAVLAAAERLFLAQGYANATVRTVAKAAGVTTGAIYSSFAGKADMLGHLLLAYWRELQERLTTPATPFEAGEASRTHAFLQGWLEYGRNRPDASRLLVFAEQHPEIFEEMTPQLTVQLKAAQSEVLTLRGTAIQQDQAAGRLPQVDTRLLDLAFGALAEGLLTTSLRRPDEAADLTELVLRLLAPSR
jgi:AcrR family transcriptional regulator